MLKKITKYMLIFGLLSISHLCWAIPTTLIVRAKAHDAKFVGTIVGGLKVCIKDFFTGKLIVTGEIEGGTGNTKIIMLEPYVRGKIISAGKNTAMFKFQMDINQPKKLLVEVIGPLAAGLNIHKEVKTTWLIPGRDIKGDGLLFELFGLIVTPYSPKPHEIIPLGQKIDIGAFVTPMCGCPVRPGFKLWDANKYRVIATVFYKGKKITELPLKYDKKISHFKAEFMPKYKGGYRVVITANDDKNNQGVGITGFLVMAPKAYKKLMGR